MFNLVIAKPGGIAGHLRWPVVAVLMLLFTLTFSKARAQDFFPEQTDYGFRFGADVDIPGKNLSDSYHPGVNYNLGVMRYFDKFTVDVTLGYRQFKAKYPTLDADFGNGSSALFTMSPFETFAVSVGAVYNVNLSSSAKIYGGINTGLYITGYSVSYQDTYTNLYEGGTQQQAYFAPKLGAAFAINNNLDFDIRAAYNIFTAHYEVNSRTGESGTLFTSISAGLGFVYKF